MRYTIKNESLFFESDSFNVEPRMLRFVDDDSNYFWYPSDQKKLGTAVCFPLLGSLPDNKYRYDGKEYTMGQHGFAQDRDFIVFEKSDSSITYELVDDERTYQQYPWHFSFRLTYALEGDSLKTSYLVENRDKKTLFFSVGGHPRYACPISREDNFEDYYIEFEKPESTVNIVKSFGPVSEIEKCFHADGKRLDLNYSMFTKGCFCFHPYNSGFLQIKNNKNSRGLFIDLSGADHLQFWTRPDAPFLAIEPFYGSISSLPPVAADGDWIHKPGILHTEPGEIFTCAFSVRPLR